jgi:hypothetical protein
MATIKLKPDVLEDACKSFIKDTNEERLKLAQNFVSKLIGTEYGSKKYLLFGEKKVYTKETAIEAYKEIKYPKWDLWSDNVIKTSFGHYTTSMQHKLKTKITDDEESIHKIMKGFGYNNDIEITMDEYSILKPYIKIEKIMDKLRE